MESDQSQLTTQCSRTGYRIGHWRFFISVNKRSPALLGHVSTVTDLLIREARRLTAINANGDVAMATSRPVQEYNNYSVLE